MADKRKVEIVWGIRKTGNLIPRLTRYHRWGAVGSACTLFGYDKSVTWEQLRRRGFTVHKLEVRDAR